MSDVAAESASAAGTGAEVTANDLGATSTESVASDQAVEGAGQEPELYTVKVDGREEKVTLDEALKGYQRQQDYTRKSQEVARERDRLAQVQQLADALERDPKGTITALAGVLGVSFETAAQVATQAVGDEGDEPLSRIEQQVQQLTQQLTARERSEAERQQAAAREVQVRAQIESELSQLHGKYGDFPDIELCQYAYDNGLNNLDAAYRAWQYDAHEQQRIAELNAATEAKRRSQVVSGGTSTAPSAVGQGKGGPVSIRDAWQQALKTHSA